MLSIRLAHLLTFVAVLLFVPSSIVAGSFQAYVSGDLTDPANWSDGVLPPTNSFSFIAAQGLSSLYLSNDFEVNTLGIDTGSNPVALDLKGHELRSILQVFADSSSTPTTSLTLKNGTFKGELRSYYSTVLEDLVVDGFFSQIAVNSSSAIQLKHVSGQFSTWVLNPNGSDTNNFTIGAKSHIAFGKINTNSVIVGEESTVNVDNLIADQLNVVGGSQLNANTSQFFDANIGGTGTNVDLGTLSSFHFGGNTRARIAVDSGAEVKVKLAVTPTNFYYRQLENFSVDGIGSKLSVQAAPNDVLRLSRIGGNDSIFGRITNGATFEVDSWLELRGGLNVTDHRLDIVDATFKGNILATLSTINLENALIEGESLLLDRATLVGSGLLDVASIGLFNSTLNPEGLLTINGSVFGTSKWLFEIRSSEDFDVVHILGDLNEGQDLHVAFAPDFRGKVGDAFEFFRIDGQSPFAPGLEPLLDIIGLPAGYAYRAIVDANSISLVITAVPEVGTIVTTGLALMLITLGLRWRSQERKNEELTK